MKPISAISYLLLSFSIILAGCGEDKKENETPTAPESDAPKVIFQFSATYNGTPLQLGEVYTTEQGYRIQIEEMKSYISNIKFYSANDDVVTVKDIALINFANPSTIEVEAPVGQFIGMSMGLGVPQNINKNIDPTTYPNSHPLSIQGSTGMFWTWNTGYIFTKFEGRCDFTGTPGAPLTDPFAFHSGDDYNYRTANFVITKNFEKENTYTIPVVLRVEKLIAGPDDPIDLQVDFLTHTSNNPALATRFVNKLAFAFDAE